MTDGLTRAATPHPRHQARRQAHDAPTRPTTSPATTPATNHVTPGTVATSHERAKNATTITIQAAICTPEAVSRVIVGLMWPTRSGAGGGALGGSLNEPARLDGVVLGQVPRDREGLWGAGAVVGERVTIGAGADVAGSIILCAPAFRHPGWLPDATTDCARRRGARKGAHATAARSSLRACRPPPPSACAAP